MNGTYGEPITVHCIIDAPVALVWKTWTTPEDIEGWNNPTPEWRTVHVENELRPGGRFLFRMERRDQEFHFDFEGIYEAIEPNRLIRYTLTDGRQSTIRFSGDGPVTVSETFVPENTEPRERQEAFCAQVLSSFKRYTEALRASGNKAGDAGV